ncbi:MAG: hypothetical protein HXL34_08160 [Prevotellaceae bacterium]|nr:hypothetical protein [Prevotellaceae bacterium]
MICPSGSAVRSYSLQTARGAYAAQASCRHPAKQMGNNENQQTRYEQ